MSSLGGEEPWSRLARGDRFSVVSQSGSLYETTLLSYAADREAGLYVRLADRTIARLLPERLKASTIKRLGLGESLFPGDNLLFLSAEGEFQGVLGEDSRQVLKIEGEGGAEKSLSHAEAGLGQLRLVFPSRGLRRGDEFQVKSNSGREIRGLVLRSDLGSVRVRVPAGDTFSLDLARIDMATLSVLVPIELGSPDKTPLVEAPPPDQTEAPSPSSTQTGLVLCCDPQGSLLALARDDLDLFGEGLQTLQEALHPTSSGVEALLAPSEGRVGEAWVRQGRLVLSVLGDPCDWGYVAAGQGGRIWVAASSGSLLGLVEETTELRDEPALQGVLLRALGSKEEAAGATCSRCGEAREPDAPCPACSVEVDTGSLAGKALGNYGIERELGHGGMGTVYLARDKLLERPVVIKVMRPELTQNQRIRERFLREARAALAFSHPNAIPTRSCEISSSGLLYLVQDFSPGKSLDQLLVRGESNSPERSLGLIRQLLRALREAHQQGILHRDLKPANLMIEQDRQGRDHLRVCDFGLAKLVDHEEGDLTGDNVIGTPAYMAPEQASGQATDARTDLYQAGVILYELLTGARPFRGSVQQLVMQQIAAKPPELSESGVDFEPAVEALVAKALAKTPSERFQTAAEFTKAIDALGLKLEGHGNESSRTWRDEATKTSDLEIQAYVPPEQGGTALKAPPQARVVTRVQTTAPPSDWLERAGALLVLGLLSLSVLRALQVALASL